jgi:imidazole glycerol phosphate synthase subunit HisF
VLTTRIIPGLDGLDGSDGRVVEGVPCVALRDADDAVAVVENYDAPSTDELSFFDLTTSYECRGTLLDIVRHRHRIDEGLSTGGADGALCASIFRDDTLIVAVAKTYLAKRGLTVRPAPRTLQPREMS